MRSFPTGLGASPDMWLAGEPPANKECRTVPAGDGVGSIAGSGRRVVCTSRTASRKGVAACSRPGGRDVPCRDQRDRIAMLCPSLGCPCGFPWFGRQSVRVGNICVCGNQEGSPSVTYHADMEVMERLLDELAPGSTQGIAGMPSRGSSPIRLSGGIPKMWSTTPFKCGTLSEPPAKMQVRGGG